MRIKEQETSLTLQEHDVDDDGKELVILCDNHFHGTCKKKQENLVHYIRFKSLHFNPKYLKYEEKFR